MKLPPAANKEERTMATIAVIVGAILIGIAYTVFGR